MILNLNFFCFSFKEMYSILRPSELAFKKVSDDSGNDLQPKWHQAITWINADLYP